VPADRLAALLSALVPGSTTGEIVYNNTRSVWVEPTTGQYIKVQETQQKTLVGNNGQSAEVLNAVFTYTDDTIARSADTAASNRQLLQIVTMWGPIALVVVGLILLVVGLMLIARRTPGRHAGPTEEPADLDGVKASS
jgi:hypothetical protein